MNLRNLVIATLVGAAVLGDTSASDLVAGARRAPREYSTVESGMDRQQGSILLIAFEEFADTPTVANPELLTVEVEFPTNGGAGSSSVTLTCQSVESTVLEEGFHIFTCHLDGDIHTLDGEIIPNEGRAVRIYADANWAEGGGDTSEEVDDTDNENLLFIDSGVPYEKPTHHWDNRPFQVQTGEFTVDSIVTHRYGIFKVEHRIGRTGGWTQAALFPKIGADPTKPRVPVWRSTLTPPCTDTFDGTIQVKVTPLRGRCWCTARSLYCPIPRCR